MQKWRECSLVRDASSVAGLPLCEGIDWLTGLLGSWKLGQTGKYWPLTGKEGNFNWLPWWWLQVKRWCRVAVASPRKCSVTDTKCWVRWGFIKPWSLPANWFAKGFISRGFACTQTPLVVKDYTTGKCVRCHFNWMWYSHSCLSTVWSWQRLLLRKGNKLIFN